MNFGPLLLLSALAVGGVYVYRKLSDDSIEIPGLAMRDDGRCTVEIRAEGMQAWDEYITRTAEDMGLGGLDVLTEEQAQSLALQVFSQAFPDCKWPPDPSWSFVVVDKGEELVLLWDDIVRMLMDGAG